MDCNTTKCLQEPSSNKILTSNPTKISYTTVVCCGGLWAAHARALSYPAVPSPVSWPSQWSLSYKSFSFLQTLFSPGILLNAKAMNTGSVWVKVPKTLGELLRLLGARAWPWGTRSPLFASPNADDTMLTAQGTIRLAKKMHHSRTWLS